MAQWKKPSQGDLKLNCDYAALSENVIGIGFVIRDDQGKVKLAGRAQMEATGNNTLLEGVAMRYALSSAKQYKLKIEQVESDNQSLIEGINGRREMPAYCDVVVADIKRMAMEVECKSFEAIPREANSVAHFAARLPDFCSLNHAPSLLDHFIREDVRT